jgi:N-glycosylase/DNA lyase
MSAMAWTEWQHLPLAQEITAELVKEQLDGGQSFRWQGMPGNVWRGILGDRLIDVRPARGGVDWRGLRGQSEMESALKEYFDAEGRQALIVDRLPWRSDKVLATAIKNFSGLRILRHDPHETLIGFLCSSNKRIIQIKVMVAALARTMGEKITDEHYALPTWSRLSRATDAELKACALGYRAAFIRGTAKKLESRPRWADEMQKLSTADLLIELQTLPGVGPKVAACVALFGFGRLESFPVDTWVVQALASAYELKGWKPDRLAEFGRTHFGDAAGLAQQYLFASARAGLLVVPENVASSTTKRKPKKSPKSRK